jgi:8-oxo-dGTP pyrophosphatase MutT (NUDIX family)
MSDIYKAAGIIIKDRKLLVEKSKNKDFFIAPGGSVEEGETEKQALVRELMEEFKIQVDENDLDEFGEFHAPAAGQEDRLVHMHCFTVKEWIGEPEPDNEVEEILWIDSSFVGKIKIGSIFEHEVLPRLRERDLVD